MKKPKPTTPNQPAKAADLLAIIPTLPPHPDDRNTQGAAAAVALHAFRRHTGADFEDAASDLLADLMHWCNRYGPGFAVELLRACTHYANETTNFTGLAPRRRRDSTNRRREAIPGGSFTRSKQP